MVATMLKLPNYKVVTMMGGAWYVAPTRWRAYLRARADCQDTNLDDYGTYLGEVASVTDLSADDAQYQLDNLPGMRGK